MILSTSRRPLRSYLVTHWRGQQPLWRSFWVNGLLLSLPLNLALQPANVSPFAALQHPILLALAFASIPLTVWQYVGIWKSARRVQIARISRFWGTTTQIVIVLSLLSVATITVTTWYAVYSVAVTPHDDQLANQPYDIVQEGSVVRFEGTIHRASATELIEALSDPLVNALEVTSGGGSARAAADVADKIQARRIRVTAGSDCLSACTFLLAASPTATVLPDSTIMLHRPTSRIASWARQVLKPGAESPDEFVADTLARYGITPEAIRHVFSLGPGEEWYPTLRELEAMHLVMYIRDGETAQYIRIPEYCRSHPAHCD